MPEGLSHIKRVWAKGTMHFGPPELKFDKDIRKIVVPCRSSLELKGMLGGSLDPLGALEKRLLGL